MSYTPIDENKACFTAMEAGISEVVTRRLTQGRINSLQVSSATVISGVNENQNQEHSSWFALTKWVFIGL